MKPLAMTSKELKLATEAEEYLSSLPQCELTTSHLLHGGVYYRTMHLEAGKVITGALIKIPTSIIISGHVMVYIGDEVTDVNGYMVIPASKNRKQVMYAISDSYVTMSFPTTAQTIEEAEDEFTDEAKRLVSRGELGINIINITKE